MVNLQVSGYLRGRPLRNACTGPPENHWGLLELPEPGSDKQPTAPLSAPCPTAQQMPVSYIGQVVRLEALCSTSMGG